MRQVARGMVSAIYGSLLFLPGGFFVLGTIIGLKAIKAGSYSQFRNELKKMIKPEISKE